MKIRIVGVLLSFLLVCSISMPGQIKAASDEIQMVQSVENINNVPYPNITNKHWVGEGSRTSKEFKVPSAGKIKVVARCIDDNVTGSFWISKDSKGSDVLGGLQSVSQISANGVISISGGEYVTYLEQGTYYLNMTASKSTWEFGIAILFENAKTEEIVMPSSFEVPNGLALNKAVRGFLSITNPTDYYCFTIQKKSIIHTKCTYKQMSDAGIELLDDRMQTIEVQSIGTDKTKEFQTVLDPGTYYIAVSGVDKTELLVKAEEFNLTLKSNTQKPTKKDITIKVKSIKDYNNMIWYKGTVRAADLYNNSIWGSNYTYDANGNQTYISDYIRGDSFAVSQNGTYTVRVLDQNGNALMKSIKISNIDRTKPTINVKNSTYKKGIKISAKDKNGIYKITLNGKTIKNGYKISRSGRYYLKVLDRAGNLKTATFQVK